MPVHMWMSRHEYAIHVLRLNPLVDARMAMDMWSTAMEDPAFTKKWCPIDRTYRIKILVDVSG